MNFLNRLANPLEILYSLPGILVGLVLHELAHAYAADRLGDPTPRNMGRLSLNPLKHIDPFGFLMLLVAGFGWAKPVITNPSYYRRRRYGFAIVGLAGPLTNLVLGYLFFFLYMLILFNMPGIGPENHGMRILAGAFVINFALFTFNLIPVPPLDGFGILKDTVLYRHVNSQAIWTLERYGSLILLALLFTGIASRIISFVVGYLMQFGTFLFSLFL